MFKIIIASGKGGIGKTTISAGIALALAKRGHKVGLLDADLESSSLGDIMGITHDDLKFNEKIEPVERFGVKAISLSLFNEPDFIDTPTLIDETRKHHLINQLLTAINWGELDFMICDLCPGSGEELRGLIKQKIDGLVLVVATQRLSVMPVRRLIRAAKEEYKIPILGIIENNPYNIEGETGKDLSEKYEIPLLATIPWDPSISSAMDQQISLDTGHFDPIAKFLIDKFIPEEPKPHVPRRRKAEPKIVTPDHVVAPDGLEIEEIPNETDIIFELKNQGLSVRKIAEKVGMSKSKVYNILKEGKNNV